MTDQDLDRLLQRIGDLERRLNFWRVAAVVLAALLVLPTVGAGLLGVSLAEQLRLERVRAMEEVRRAELERARAEEAEAEARMEALRAQAKEEQRLRQAEEQPPKDP